MVPASSVLKFLYLANQLGLDPYIEHEGGNFTIRYHYPDRYRNERIVIDGDSVNDSSGCDNNCLYSELEYLVEKYNEKQNNSEDEERQQILDKLSDREKELLGLS
mgnify:FL=1